MRTPEQDWGQPGWQGAWPCIADWHHSLVGTGVLLCHTEDPRAAAAAGLRRRRLTEAACYYFWLLQQCVKNLRLG